MRLLLKESDIIRLVHLYIQSVLDNEGPIKTNAKIYIVDENGDSTPLGSRKVLFTGEK